MHPVLDNPFRLLSLFSNAMLSEIGNQVGMIRTSLRMGRQRKMTREIVLPELPQVERTAANVKTAAEELTMPVRRLAWARYWWMNATMTDDYALTCLEEGRVEMAKSTWKRNNSWSALQNLLVLHLVLGDARSALDIAHQLYPVHAQELAKAVLGESYDAEADDGGERFLSELSFLAQQEVTDEEEKDSPTVREATEAMRESLEDVGAMQKNLRDVSENLGDNAKIVGENAVQVPVSSPSGATKTDIPSVVLPPNYEQRKKERRGQEEEWERLCEETDQLLAEAKELVAKVQEEGASSILARYISDKGTTGSCSNATTASENNLATQEEKEALVSSSSEIIVTNMCLALAAISVITMFFNFSTGFILILSAFVLFCAGAFRGSLRRNTKQSIAREKRKRNMRAKAAGQEKYVPISGNAGCWIGLVLALAIAFPLILVINALSIPLYFTVIGVLSFLVLVLV